VTTQKNLPSFKDVEPGVVPDFQVEDKRQYGVTYYTPYSDRAEEWAERHLKDVPRHGRSFMFKMNDDPNNRGKKLRGFLKKEGFVVSR